MVGAREEEVLRDGVRVSERVVAGERLSVGAREEEMLREGVSGPERVAEGE